MNLVEHYILEIKNVEDDTENFTNYMKKTDPNFELKEKIFWIEMVVDCYGIKETVRQLFSESEYKEMVEKGYYLG